MQPRRVRAAELDLLLSLFARTNAVPLIETAKTLYPKISEEDALKKFRVFKARFNKKIAPYKFEMYSDPSNSAAANKTVSFLSTDPDEEDMDKAVNTLARQAEASKDGAAYPFPNYIPAEVVNNARLVGDVPIPSKDWVKAARFPKIVDDRMKSLLPDVWAGLSENDRTTLCNLAVRLEPFLRIDGNIPKPPLVGFELLALGPDGATYGQLLSWASIPNDQNNPRVPTVVIDLTLLLVGICTIRRYTDALRDNQLADNIELDKLFFTLNLTPSLLNAGNGNSISEVLRWSEVPPEKLVFEVHESCEPNDVKKVLKVKDAWKTGLALDDSKGLDPHVKLLLADRVILEKADHQETHALLSNTPGDVDETIAAIQQRTQSNKLLRGFVLEGVGSQGLDHLKRHWNCGGTPLLVQGWEIKAEAVYKKPLLGLEKTKGKHGYALSPDFTEGRPGDMKTEKTIKKFLPNYRKIDVENPDFSVFENLADASERCVYLHLKKDNPYQRNNKEQEKYLSELMRQIEEYSPSIVVVHKEDWCFYHLEQRERENSASFIVTTPEEVDRDAEQLRRAGHHALNLFKDVRLNLYDPKIYVPSEVATREGERFPVEKESPEITTPTATKEGRAFLRDWLLKGKEPFVLLLGDSGMGKTFLCRMFTRELIEIRRERPETPLPVYIDLRHVAIVRNKDTKELHIPHLEDMLQEAFKRQEIEVDAKLAMKAARAGRIIFIFDGVDEKVAHFTTAEADQFIRMLCSIHKPPYNTRTILACRTHYFKDQADESRRMKGGGGGGDYSQDGLSHKSFLTGYVRPFDVTRIRSYLDRVLGKDKAESALDAMEKAYNLIDLSKRPYLLSLVAGRVARLAKEGASGRFTGTGAIYEELVDEWIYRDTGKHFIPPEEKPRVMGMLARDMWQNGATSLHYKKLGAWVTGNVREFLMNIGGKECTADDTDRALSDVRTATFLMRDDEGHFSFAHRSFMEFFLARLLLSQLVAGNIDVLNLPVIQREVVHFFIDLLSTPAFHKDIPTVAEKIASILKASYRPLVSENGFLVLTRWRQSGKAGAPNLEEIHLEKAALSGVDIAGCNFNSVYLDGADVSDANLDNVRFGLFHAPGATLEGVRAAGAQLPHANLQKARIIAASFTGADLSSADLSDADLSFTTMRETSLENAVMPNVNATGGRWEGLSAGGVDLRRARLAGTEIVRCNLDGADMRGAIQSHASFGACDMRRVKWAGAVFEYTGMGNCQLNTSEVNPLVHSDSAVKEALSSEEDIGINFFTGHSNTVTSVCFSPDGKTIASGSYDNTIRYWNVKDGGLIAVTVSLPGGEWAAYNRQKLLASSPGAHKYLGYAVGQARIPVEAFN